jgi:hypothetical protein
MMPIRLYFAAFNVAGMRRDSKAFGNYLAMRRGFEPGHIGHVVDWIGSYDIVVPKANNESIERQWKQSHDAELWDVLVEAVSRSPFFDGRPNYISFQLERCHFANMYIMRRELLDEYLRFCFGVLADCRSKVALTGRALGYFSERVFSFWLYQKRVERPDLKILELPFLFHDPSLDQALDEARSVRR